MNGLSDVLRQAAGVSGLEDFLRVPDWDDLIPPERPSTEGELKAAERALGHRLPRPLRLVLKRFGGIQLASYRLLGTDPDAELSLVKTNTALRGNDPPLPEGFTAIALATQGENLKVMGIWRPAPGARWILAEWIPGDPGATPMPANAFESILATIMGSRKSAPKPPLPAGLHRHYDTLGGWIESSLENIYSFASPVNWRDGEAWDRYFLRHARKEEHDSFGEPDEVPTDAVLALGYKLRGWVSYNFALTGKVAGFDVSRPVLFAGNGFSQDPMEQADVGWECLVVYISSLAILWIRASEEERKRQHAAEGKPASGRVEAVHGDLYNYTPPAPLSGIVMRNLFHGYTAEEREELIRRFASWLAPGGFCYFHTDAGESHDLKEHPGPWDRYGFRVLGAKSHLAFMECRLHTVPYVLEDGTEVRRWTQEAEEKYRAVEQEEAQEEAAHRAAGGFFLITVCGA